MSSFLAGLVSRAAGLTASQGPAPAAPAGPEPAEEPAELVEEVESAAPAPRPLRDRPELPPAAARDRPSAPAAGSERPFAARPETPPEPPPLRPHASETAEEEPSPAPVRVPAPPPPAAVRPEPVAADAGRAQPSLEEVSASAESGTPLPPAADSAEAVEVRHVFEPTTADRRQVRREAQIERLEVGVEASPEPQPMVATPIPAAPMWPSEQPSAEPDRTAPDGEGQPAQTVLVREAAEHEPVLERTPSAAQHEWREPEPPVATDPVEIHIGTIELTVAEPDAPVPERAPPQPPDPQGFDAYAAIR